MAVVDKVAPLRVIAMVSIFEHLAAEVDNLDTTHIDAVADVVTVFPSAWPVQHQLDAAAVESVVSGLFTVYGVSGLK